MTAGAKVWNGTGWDTVAGDAAAALVTPRSIGLERTSSTNPALLTATVSPSATAHTKGSWVQLTAAVTEDVDLVTLLVQNTGASSGNGLALADIGQGPNSGAVTTLVANVPVGSAPNSTTGRFTDLDIPIHIAAGDPLWIRWQSARTSASDAVFAAILSTLPGITMPSELDTIGADTATSGGVVLATTADTFTEIVAVAPQDYQGVVIGVMSSRTNIVAGPAVVDLGVGPEGSEQLYRSGRYWQMVATEEVRLDVPSSSAYMAVDIAAGERIAVKHHTGTSVGYTGYNVVLLGVPA